MIQENNQQLYYRNSSELNLQIIATKRNYYQQNGTIIISFPQRRKRLIRTGGTANGCPYGFTIQTELFLDQDQVWHTVCTKQGVFNCGVLEGVLHVEQYGQIIDNRIFKPYNKKKMKLMD